MRGDPRIEIGRISRVHGIRGEVVIVAHDADLNVEDLANNIDCAISQELDQSRIHAFYEVRAMDTKEVTLGSIDLSLEEGYPLETATSTKEAVPAD